MKRRVLSYMRCTLSVWLREFITGQKEKISWLFSCFLWFAKLSCFLWFEMAFIEWKKNYPRLLVVKRFNENLEGKIRKWRIKRKKHEESN